MKIDRLITILMMLINRKKVTAKELSEYFNVSVRTIQRDMDTLDMAGVPLYSDVGKNGGYRLLDNYKLNNNFLNIDEGKLLISLLGSLEDTIPNSDVQSIYNKMLTLVPESEREENLVVRLNPVSGQFKFRENLRALSKARDHKLKTKMIYIDINFNKSTRIINPHTLILIGSVWYVYGFCELREGFRMFKLARIHSCELLDEGFERRTLPEALPWDNYYDSNRENTHIELEVDISQRDKLWDYFNYENCKIVEDKIIVHMDYPVDEWVYSLLAGLIPYVKIIEPQWVREEFAKRIKIALENNQI